MKHSRKEIFCNIWFRFIYLFMWWAFYLHVCTCSTCVPGACGGQKRHQTSWNWRYGWLWAKPGSSIRAGSTLGHQTISLAPGNLFCYFKNILLIISECVYIRCVSTWAKPCVEVKGQLYGISPLLPSTFMWVPVIELGLPGLFDRCLQLLNHLASTKTEICILRFSGLGDLLCMQIKL